MPIDEYQEKDQIEQAQPVEQSVVIDDDDDGDPSGMTIVYLLGCLLVYAVIFVLYILSRIA